MHRLPSLITSAGGGLPLSGFKNPGEILREGPHRLHSLLIKSGLTVIGLDVKKNIEESFSDKGTLDDLIFILENGKISEVAVEKIGISYNQNDDAINHFLQWVLENGTKYNHEYGLLNLDNKLTQEQISKVKTTLTAQK